MSIPSRPRAVITGAGSGLGRELAIALGKRHGQLLLADINLAGAEETAALVTAQGGRALVQRCDVAQPESVAELAQLAQRELGAVDLLVNNAGVAVGGIMEEVPLEDWRWVLSINLLGVVHGCRAFLPEMKRRKAGHILNVASAAGLMSAPEMAPYNVTKAGVVALSETLYSELRPYQIGVTVLCPSFFQTGLLSTARAGKEEQRPIVEALMRNAKVQAPQVAERALVACNKRQLYCLPMSDSQVAWALKRLSPENFYARVVGRLLGGMRKGAEKR
jgi:NAD(P)-dependent dehydrogenase (short-subunit alcohol dehydrogenase family)